MQIEFHRLESLGWRLPKLNSLGLFESSQIDESKISFPSENYDSDVVNAEALGFWAVKRAQLIAEMLNPKIHKTLWEVGAGNGNAAIPLRDLGLNVITIEPLLSGAVTLQKNGFATFHSTLEGLNLPSDSLSAIGAFDVLEHLENPQELLSEIYRVLKPGGVFICSVPAYQWLFSDFDASIGHYRRYSRKLLESTLNQGGFKVITTEYLYGFLVPIAFVLRRVLPIVFGRIKKDGKRRTGGANSKNLNRLSYVFGIFVSLEKIIGIKLGLSLFSIGEKQVS